MPAEKLAEAVRLVDGRVLTEASGGVTAQTARTVAASGVDLLSLGWLTHSAPALNLSLEISLAFLENFERNSWFDNNSIIKYISINNIFIKKIL